MTKFLFYGAFALGLLAIIWVARLFFGVDWLGLGVTLVIGLVYVIGAWELVTFRRATSTLFTAFGKLEQPLSELGQWLANIHPSLQNSVRQRVQGERGGLPAPVITPYLVGLLVMLGLLGTFIGMVDTLKGAVVALEGSNELEAIRAGLAAPIEGLGLAFGTSVAGVAASAMLGLLSTISRRERLHASHLLDTHIASGSQSGLRQFSTSYQQHLAFKAIQEQAQALPAVADQLVTLSQHLEQLGERIGDRLSSTQEQFQTTISEQFSELNQSVDQSLKSTLIESAELINASIQPLAEKTLKELNSTAKATQEQLSVLGEQQLQVVSDAIKSNEALVRESLENNLTEQGKSTEALVASVQQGMSDAQNSLQNNSQTLLSQFSSAGEKWALQQKEQAAQFSASIREELASLRAEESQRGQASIDRLAELESTVSTHLASLGQALEEPMLRLIDTASQTPKAAADVIEKLRGEMTKNMERDNELLSERTELMQQLETLSTSMQNSSLAQREAIDDLIGRSSDTLAQVSTQFAAHLDTESSKLTEVADHFSSSSAEIASLGESFNTAVAVFSESNSQLIENLTRIEEALEQSNNRSDEQLGYYVTQAREIIDHNLLSHKEIIDALRAQQGGRKATKEAS